MVHASSPGGHGEGSFIDTPSYNPKSVLWDSLSMDALRGKWGKGHVTRAMFDGEHAGDVVSPIWIGDLSVSAAGGKPPLERHILPTERYPLSSPTGALGENRPSHFVKLPI